MGRQRKRAANSRKFAKYCFDLPVELLIEVMARLPAKPLLKFRCVCKEWRSLIDSPNFASLHLSLCNNNHLFLIENYGYKRQCFIRHSDTFRGATELVLPKDYGLLSPIDYANGLVLCSTSMTPSRFVLWNPSIRKSMEIFPPFSPCYVNYLVGFMHVTEQEDEYKVVLIPDSWSATNLRLMTPYVQVQIYSLRANSWRSFNIDHRSFPGLQFVEKITFLNRAVHWLRYLHGIPLSSNSHIVAVDMETEALNNFQLPDGWSTVGRHSRQVLAVLGESLAFLDMESGCSFIWVMEQYGVANSWVKRFVINLEYNSFILLRRSGKLLVTIKQRIKQYDVESQEIKDIAKGYFNRVEYIDTFVEA